MISTDDARAYCLRQPGMTADDCAEWLKVHSVNGTFCDGNVLSTRPDPNGPIVRTCIPEGDVERKLAAEAASPLPRPVSSASTLVLVAGALAVGASIYFFARR